MWTTGNAASMLSLPDVVVSDVVVDPLVVVSVLVLLPVVVVSEVVVESAKKTETHGARRGEQ